VKAIVVGLHGDLVGKRFPIGQAPVTFGRGEDNDIVIPDPAVSRLHAELRQEGDGFVIADRGSANGTVVNGALMPDDAVLRTHLESLSGPLLHTLLVSGPWDTANVGGEEVDIDWLLEGPKADPLVDTEELAKRSYSGSVSGLT